MTCAILPPSRRIGKNYPNGFNPDSFTIAREFRGLSRQDLAHKTGLSVPVLGQIETGRLAPTATQAGAVAMMTGFPLAFFKKPVRDDAGFADSPLWVCSHDDAPPIQACSRCLYIADALCDFPVGDGKTCDLPLCEQHRIRQGGELADIDYCPQHALIAQGMVNNPAPG